MYEALVYESEHPVVTAQVAEKEQAPVVPESKNEAPAAPEPKKDEIPSILQKP